MCRGDIATSWFKNTGVEEATWTDEFCLMGVHGSMGNRQVTQKLLWLSNPNACTAAEVVLLLFKTFKKAHFTTLHN